MHPTMCATTEAGGNPLESDRALADVARQFAELRPRLFGIAYRMLGSVSDAEDILQDVWLKWQACDRDAVRDSVAFLSTVTTRLAINATQTARARRESYVGPWLPEPVDTTADPALGAERGEVLETAVLLVLEKLTPPERAAFVLREAFGYPYDRIAEVLQTREENARKLLSRARRHLTAERGKPVAPDRQRQLLTAFLSAARAGDFDQLESLFTVEVASYSDGDGVRGASRIPVLGRTRVARYVAAFAERFWAGTNIDWIDANGRASVLVTRDDVPVAWLSVGGSRDQIDRIFWVMNPAKLGHIAGAVRGTS